MTMLLVYKIALKKISVLLRRLVLFKRFIQRAKKMIKKRL